jgi:hypothetical protein
MDQKLLLALNNLSEGLEAIAAALSEKGSGSKSATTEALQGGNFITEIKEINVGVKQLLADSKKILKNQETIISLSKKSSVDKKSEFERVGGDKKKESELKKGVGTILLIAVAVLAIGMAFKLVGGINFLSVIGLSIAILIIAKAFEKLAALKMSLKEAAIVSASIVLMAIGITVSSWILKKITPISFTQVLTMILIGVGFSVLSPAIGKIITAFGGMSWMSILKAAVGLVLVLPAIAMGITLSSWILRKVTPIGFAQAITSILIAAVFSVVSYGIKNMLGAFKGMGPLTIAMAVVGLPLILPAVSKAIWLSSIVLGKVRPIGLAQAITSILVAAVFSVAAYGINKILTAFKDMSATTMAVAIIALPLLLPAMAAGIWLSSIALSKVKMMTFGQFVVSLGISILFIVFAVALKLMSPIIEKLSIGDVLLIPLLMTTLSVAVWASSHILKKTADIKYEMMLKILVFSIVFAIAVIVLATVAWVIGKYFGVMNVLKGSVAIVALAGVVMLSSWMISKGQYKKYPDWKWSLMSGLSIAVFGVIAWGLMKLGDISTYIEGGLAILAVASSVMLTSHILAVGNYSNYPKLPWAIGVAASIAAFAAGAVILGPMVFGPQALIYLAGLGAVLGLATTVMAASHILAKGNYKKGPDLLWTLSVSTIMGTFGKLTAVLGVMPKSWVKDGANAIKSIVKSIVDSALIFRGVKFVGGPTKEWATSVGIALGAFSPVYKMLMNNAPGIFSKGGGVGPNEFAKAIITVTRGIVTAAKEFASPDNKGIWKKAPTKEWATGVGTALNAFMPLYAMLMNNALMKTFTGKGGVGPAAFAGAVITVSKGIIAAAKEFAKNTAPFKEGMYPSVKWGQGVGAALQAFAPVFKALHEDSGMFTSGKEVIDNMINGIVSIAGAIVRVGRKFEWSKLKWDSTPTKAWSWNVSQSIKSYVKLASEIGEDMFLGDLYLPLKVVNSMIVIGKRIEKNKNAFNSHLNPGFIKNLRGGVRGYVSLTEFVTSSPAMLLNEGGVNKVAAQMAITARIIEKNKKHFAYSIPRNFIAKLAPNLLGYAAMSRALESLMTVTEKKFIPLSALGGTDVHYTTTRAVDVSMVNRVAAQMSLTAAIVGKNAKYFNAKIDPNFMKSVASNLFYYMAVAKKLQSQRGGLGSMIKNALGGDPMTNMANGMMLLAKAYDKLASSITKMGSAMNNINEKKLSQMERMSKINTKTESKGFFGSVGDAVGSVVGAVANVASAVVSTPSGPGSSRKEKPRVGKYGDIHKQNDMIIDMLRELNEKLGPGSSIDTVMQKKLTEKKGSSLQ